jgi:hypothetical protein
MSTGKWYCTMKTQYCTSGRYINPSVYDAADLDTRLEKGDYFVRIELKELPIITEKNWAGQGKFPGLPEPGVAVYAYTSRNGRSVRWIRHD